MSSERRGQWRLDTTSGPDVLASVRAVLAAFRLSHGGCPDDVWIGLEIAAAEIAANIVEHGGRATPIRIHMSVLEMSQRVEIVFTDSGPPADVDLEVPLPHEMAERGRGVPLARAAVDELSYSHELGENRWTLVSRRFS